MQFQPGLREPGFGPGSRKWRCLLYSRSIGAFSFNFQVVFAGWVNAMREAQGGRGRGPGNTGLYSKIRADRRSPHCGIAFHAAPLSTMSRGTNRFAKWRGEGGKIIIIKKKGKQKKGIKNRKKHGSRETDEVGWTGKEVLRLFSILIWSSVWFDLDRISMNGIFFRKNMSLLNIYNFTDLLLID